MRYLALALFLFACDAKHVDRRLPEDFARQFAGEIPGSTGRVQCMDRDTDGDGYCSCSVFMKDAPPVAVECGCDSWQVLFPPDGCRMAQFKVRGNGGGGW